MSSINIEVWICYSGGEGVVILLRPLTHNWMHKKSHGPTKISNEMRFHRVYAAKSEALLNT